MIMIIAEKTTKIIYYVIIAGLIYLSLVAVHDIGIVDNSDRAPVGLLG